jgi:hypothetical protein
LRALRRPVFLALALVLALAFALVGDRATGTGDTTGATAGGDKSSAAAGYMRLRKTGDDAYTLELASRTFVGTRPGAAKGSAPVSVTLISAMHIGSADYYARLQQILDARDLLLFEGVGGETDDDIATGDGGTATGDAAGVNIVATGTTARLCAAHAVECGGGAHESEPRAPVRAASRRKRSVSTDDLYGLLAGASGLVTQHTGINYDRPRFRNADLSLPAMRKILRAEIRRGGPAGRDAAEAFQLMGEMEKLLGGGGGVELLVLRGLTSLMRGSAAARALFLLNLASVDEDLNAAGALRQGFFDTGGTRRLMRLVLDDRNAAAMRLLEQAMRERGAPGDFGVFYGAAHMRGMEEILTRKWGFRPTRTRWLPVFTVSPAAAGVPDILSRPFLRKAVGE